MIRDCITCGQRTILPRYVDNLPVVMDGEPCTDGQALLVGDLNGQPTALFGIETEDDAAFWRVPFAADRYDKHVCQPAIVLIKDEFHGAAEWERARQVFASVNLPTAGFPKEER